MLSVHFFSDSFDEDVEEDEEEKEEEEENYVEDRRAPPPKDFNRRSSSSLYPSLNTSNDESVHESTGLYYGDGGRTARNSSTKSSSNPNWSHIKAESSDDSESDYTYREVATTGVNTSGPWKSRESSGIDGSFGRSNPWTSRDAKLESSYGARNATREDLSGALSKDLFSSSTPGSGTRYSERLFNEAMIPSSTRNYRQEVTPSPTRNYLPEFQRNSISSSRDYLSELRRRSGTPTREYLLEFPQQQNNQRLDHSGPGLSQRLNQNQGYFPGRLVDRVKSFGRAVVKRVKTVAAFRPHIDYQQWVSKGWLLLVPVIIVLLLGTLLFSQNYNVDNDTGECIYSLYLAYSFHRAIYYITDLKKFYFSSFSNQLTCLPKSSVFQ